jgi:hypothetical protein
VGWTRLRLELARSRLHPEGSHRIAYDLTLPLDANGRLDRVAFRDTPEPCTVHCFREDSDDRVGALHRRPGGYFVFAYGEPVPLEEKLPHFAEHRFAVGDYVSVSDPFGGEHTFRVV